MGLEIQVIELPFPGELAVCAGGKPVVDCDVATDLKNGTVEPDGEQFHSKLQTVHEGDENLSYPSFQAYFPLGCVACRKMCEAVYEIKNGKRISDNPAVFWMDPEVYERVRAPALENLTRRLE